jgi:hypothetical protein
MVGASVLPKTHVLVGKNMAVCTTGITGTTAELLEMVSFRTAVRIGLFFVVAARGVDPFGGERKDVSVKHVECVIHVCIVNSYSKYLE